MTTREQAIALMMATFNQACGGTKEMRLENVMTARQLALSQLGMDGAKDINAECGYPDIITIQNYQEMFEREGVGARVVRVWPKECWSMFPQIYEKEALKVITPFEKAWEKMEEELDVLSYLFRVDELSGVGRFGVLLLGFDDGEELKTPMTKKDAKLIYLNVFSESSVTIASWETDTASPRFQKPLSYNISFAEESGLSGDGAAAPVTATYEVHWTRIIHIADNLQMSEVYGTPRMKVVWNRLLDIRKTAGAAAEMFWKGGWPGISFEYNGTDPNVALDTESIREEMDKYMNGLQRYVATTGMTAKSLAPQISDPTGTLQALLDLVALAADVPKRVLFGSEQSQLASTQDIKTWNRRVAGRRINYINPRILKPFFRRMMEFGVLPTVSYRVFWPDLNTLSDEEKAKIGETWAKMVEEYVRGGGDQMIPVGEFLSICAGLSDESVRRILEALQGESDMRKIEQDVV